MNSCTKIRSVVAMGLIKCRWVRPRLMLKGVACAVVNCMFRRDRLLDNISR
jgi:hypothetical protein